jgi:phosphate transport system protein
MKSTHDEMDALASNVSRLGGIAEGLLADAIAAVVRRDTLLAQDVIVRDAIADQAEREIERAVLKLIAHRQPMAGDLRHALAAMKIAGELERIGDLSKNIAKRTLTLNLSEPVPVSKRIEAMGKVVAGLLNQVLNAYTSQDVAVALAVWRHDEEVDVHYESLFRELLTYMMEDHGKITASAHLLFVAKNIERIGDHCTNIAEMVHFQATGQEIVAERPRGAPGDDAP